MHRLEHESPELYRLLVQANYADARLLVARSCQASVKGAGLNENWIDKAIEELLNGGTFHKNDQKRIAKIARKLDDTYLDLQENGREYDVAFKLARAASGVATAISAASSAELLDAAYECLFGFDPDFPRSRIIARLGDTPPKAPSE